MNVCDSHLKQRERHVCKSTSSVPYIAWWGLKKKRDKILIKIGQLSKDVVSNI